MEQLLSLKKAVNLPQLGAAKMLSLAVVAIGVLAAIAFVAVRPGENMGLLYSGLDPAEAGKIGQRLDEMKITYDAKSDGSTIMVPASQVARIRMELAAVGLPHQGGAGYELLDAQSPMNMTSFMQRIQRVRALEGELARTIGTMNGVKSARVHLVMPEREGFSRDVPQPTAAVTVIMDGPQRMSTSQAAAVRLLVAGAVPRMRQDDVSVLDPSGVVLAADGGTQFAMGRLNEARASSEQDLQRTLANLLEPLVGRGKVRVAASVDLETARQTEREEKFDPLTQVERSRQSQNDRDSSDESKSQPPVTVGQNLPNQKVNAGDGGHNNTTSSHTGETVNYEISSTTSERVREPGDLKRLTIAVAVDGVLDAKGEYLPRSKDELDRLSELVRSAVGYDEKRGDKVTVETMRFAPLDALGTSSDGPEAAPASGLPLKLVLPIVGGLLLLLGLFGFLAMRRKPAPIALATERLETARLPESEDLFSIRAVGGQPRSPMLVQLNNIVDQNPDEALAVLRGWISEGTAA